MSNEGRCDVDLAVIGAGPGGAACSLIAARRGLRVLLVDPRTGTNEKPCGEGIMPSGVDALDSLGIGHARVLGRPFAGVRYVVSGVTPLEVNLPEPGLAVARRVLQGLLDDAIAAESKVMRACSMAQVAPIERGFRVVADTTTTARTLAVCDGLGGRSAPWLRGAHGRRRAVRYGLRAHFVGRTPLDRVEVHMGQGVEVYLTPLQGGVVNAAVLHSALPSDGAGAAAWIERALDAYPEARARLADPIDRPGARDLSHGSPHCLAADGAFLVGDAAGGVDPVLGCGVTIALRSGIAAARAASAVVAGDTSGRAERDYARFYRREVRARRRLARFLRLASRHPWLARRTIDAGRLVPALTGALANVAYGAGSAPPRFTPNRGGVFLTP